MRFWRLAKDLKSFKPLFRASVPGVINDIKIIQPSGDESANVICAVAAGQEHRLGRWLKVQEGKNEAVLFRLRRGLSE